MMLKIVSLKQILNYILVV